MFRANGGLIGINRSPTIGAAPGIWGPTEQITAKRGQSWVSNDPYFDKVSLLMHMEGPNNSTDFIDSSFNNLTITKVGSPVITTSSKKFGSSCASFTTPSNMYLQTPTSMLFNFGLAIDFTIEFWVKVNGYDIVQRKLITFNANASYVYPPFEVYCKDRALQWLITNSALNSVVSFTTSEPGSFPETVWHHIAIVGYNGTLKIYFNGISRISVALPSWPNIPRGIIIGQNNTISSSVTWEFDEIRVTKGVARYTSDFTVPNSQFSDG